MDESFRNPALVRLAEGRAISIAVVTMPGAAPMQAWSRSGVDLLIVDMEHGPIDLTTCHTMIAAAAGAPVTPIVRVPWNVPWVVKQALDTGAMGICFPMIADAAEAEAAVRAVRYPPRGERGWGPFYAHMRWGQTLPRYVQRADDEMFTMLLVERPEAIRNIEEIVRVPGVDMFVIAPFDLATTMGHANEREHPDVQAAIRRAEEVILRSGVPLGGAALTPAAATQLLERGYKGIFIGFDWLIVQRAVGGFLGEITL